MTEEIIATTLFVMSILVLIRHRSNIERLIAGEEDKIGQKQTS
jgi:glycerol-3-phosphate acyltransferase PlsY